MENYDILGRIGEGAHGIVLKAKHIVVSEAMFLKEVAGHYCLGRIVAMLEME